MPNSASSLLPITALVAVVIFIAKELIEIVRRWRADARRRAAFRTLLARECELNNWAIRALRHIVNDLKNLPNIESPLAFTIEYAKSGRIYACVDSDAKGEYGKSVVPVIHKTQMERHLLDIATIDNKLLKFVEPALSAAAELEHLRESLLYHGSSDADEDTRAHRSGFSEYAIGELDESYSAISALYQSCTGKSLTDMRLR